MPLDSSRWETLLAIDHDRWAVETYRANFPGVRVECANVADLIDSLPDADCILGGPPCVSFSQAGKRLGENDDRDCVPDFVRAVAVKQPRMALMENVEGMMTIDGGRYCQRLFARFSEIGYAVDVRVLDAVSFGVPQFRSRCWWWLIRADLYAAGIRHQWPKPTHVWPWPDRPSMFGGDLLPAVTVGWALNIPHMQRDGVWFEGDGVSRMVMGAGRNDIDHGDRHFERDERDITGEPCTTVAGKFLGVHKGAQNPRVHEYRWSDAMLQKHPPASPASPAPTVQAKYFKGGAEGLLDLSAGDCGTMGALARVSRSQSTIQENDRPGADSPCATRASHRGRSPIHGDGYEVLLALRKAIGEEAFQQWGIGIVESNDGAEVLRPPLYGGGVRCSIQTSDELERRPRGSPDNLPAGEMREVREAGRQRRSPQERKLAGQLADELGAYLPKLSHSRASRAEAMRDLWRASQGLGLLREALAEIQEVGRSADGERESVCAGSERQRSDSATDLQSAGLRKEVSRTRLLQSALPTGEAGKNVLLVRRLSVAECARLQSAPDDFAWPKGITKTAMCRCIGNGQANLMVRHLSQAMAKADPESKTIIDLFCGGGIGAVGWHGRAWTYCDMEKDSALTTPVERSTT